MNMNYRFTIGGRDYTPYLPMKNGLSWSRENTNDAKAGRDKANIMHPDVTSHQRKLSVKLMHMPMEECMRLEADLQAGDDGIEVHYPDMKDGWCTRLFYCTSVKSAAARFDAPSDDAEDKSVVYWDDITFDLTSIQEATV